MPKSFLFIKKFIINFLIKEINNRNLKQIKILDLGIGYGDFGKLVRRNIHIKTIISGVEIWEKYKNKKWDYYNNIIIEDIKKYIKKSKEEFDAILLIDVLEHFNQKEGVYIIKQLIDRTKGWLIVSTPVTPYPQGPSRRNPYEEHKYFWSERLFLKFGFRKICSRWVPTINRSLTFYKTLWPLVSKSEVYVFEKNSKN